MLFYVQLLRPLLYQCMKMDSLLGPLSHVQLDKPDNSVISSSCFAINMCVTVHCLYVVQQLHFTSMETSSMFEEPSLTSVLILAVVLPGLQSSCLTEYLC